jgi:hypothetical protein
VAYFASYDSKTLILSEDHTLRSSASAGMTSKTSMGTWS